MALKRSIDYERALASDDPLMALRAAVIEKLHYGVDRDEIFHDLVLAMRRLRAAGRDDDEEVMTSVMDFMEDVDEIIGPRLERFGTVEGRLEGLLAHRRRVFYIWESLTNRRVECVFGDRIPLDEVLAAFGRRVSARGLIRTRRTGEKLSVEARELYVFPPEEELPTVDEVVGILRNAG